MTTVKKPVDRTRTARQVAHLERLSESKGKRLVVDLDQEAKESLEALLGAGYAESQAAVVRKALNALAQKVVNKV